jgi:hypothetical protein
MDLHEVTWPIIQVQANVALSDVGRLLGSFTGHLNEESGHALAI